VVAASLLKLTRDYFYFESDGPGTISGISLNVLILWYFLLLLFPKYRDVFFDFSFHLFCYKFILLIDLQTCFLWYSTMWKLKVTLCLRIMPWSHLIHGMVIILHTLLYPMKVSTVPNAYDAGWNFHLYYYL